jgi:hypothetical protein
MDRTKAHLALFISGGYLKNVVHSIEIHDSQYLQRIIIVITALLVLTC